MTVSIKIQNARVNSFDPEKIEEAFPSATMIEPMQIWSLPKHKEDMAPSLFRNPDYLWQEKKDGALYTIEKTAKGEVYMFSRGVSVKTNLLNEVSAYIPHFIDYIAKLPRGTILLGELYIPDGSTKDLNSIMRCLPEKAAQRIAAASTGKSPHFYLFDVLMHNGIMLLGTPLLYRLEILDNLYEEYLLESPCLEVACSRIGSGDTEQWIRDILADERKEGVVGKLTKGAYYPGKRPAWETIKFKKKSDKLDVVCLGYVDAEVAYKGDYPDKWKYRDENDNPITKNAYNGWIGSLVVGVYDEEKQDWKAVGTVHSGLTEWILEAIKQNPDMYIKQPFVLECMEVDKKAMSFRHPRFIDWRDDIRPEECTLQKIFG